MVSEMETSMDQVEEIAQQMEAKDREMEKQ